MVALRDLGVCFVLGAQVLVPCLSEAPPERATLKLRLEEQLLLAPLLVRLLAWLSRQEETVRVKAFRAKVDMAAFDLSVDIDGNETLVCASRGDGRPEVDASGIDAAWVLRGLVGCGDALRAILRRARACRDKGMHLPRAYDFVFH